MQLRHLGLTFSFLLFLLSSAIPAEGQKVRVEGKVVSETSGPAAAAVVELHFRDGSYPEALRGWLREVPARSLATTRTDRQGQFALEFESDQLLDFRVEKEGHLPSEISLSPKSLDGLKDAASPLIRLPTVVLKPVTSWLDIRIVDRNGQPAPGALVRARYSAEGSKQMAADRWQPARILTTASEGGWARLPSHSKGNLRVSAYLEGLPPTEIDVHQETAPLELVVEPGEMMQVRVVDERSRPVAGAMIRLAPGDWPVAKTDEEGRARIPLADDETELEILTPRISAYYAIPERGSRPSRGPILIRLGAAPERRDRSPLVAQGQVLDSAGRPLSGAEIYRWDGKDRVSRAPSGRPGVSDEKMTLSREDGTFEIPLEAGASSALEIWADGHLPRWIYGVIASEAGNQPYHRVHLEPARKVAGRVVSETGVAIPRAEVVLFDPVERGLLLGRDQKQTLADAIGRFSFERIPTQSNGLRLAVFAADYVFFETTVPSVEDCPDEWEITLSPSSNFEGVILDPEREPISDATVRVLRDDLSGEFISPLATETRTDTEGRARIGGLREAQYEIEVSHPEFKRRLVNVEVRREGDSHEIILERADGYLVQGQVTSLEVETGGLGVLLKPTAEGVWLSGRPLSGLADEAGRFSITDVPRGEYEVEILGSESVLSRQDEEVVVSGPTEIELTLLPGVSITGRISGLDPIELPSLRVHALAGGKRKKGRVDATRESFRVEGLRPGGLRLVAQVAGDETKRMEVPVYVEPGETEVSSDFDFGEMLSIRGLVIRGEDLLPDARIEIDGTGADRSVTTDSMGEFAIHGLEPGRYLLQIYEEGSAWRFGDPEMVHLEAVDLDADRMLEIDIPPTSRLAGSVADSSGSPISGVAVYLSRQGDEGRVQRKTLTDGAGHFSFQRIPNGHWQLRFEKAGFSGIVRAVEVPLEMDEVDVEMHPGYEAKLRALLPKGSFPGQVSVRLLDPSGRPVFRQELSPGPDGWLSLRDLPEGSWRLWVEAESGAFATLEDFFRVPGDPQEIALRERGRVVVEAPVQAKDAAAIVILEDSRGRPVSRASLQAGLAVFDSVPADIWTFRLVTERARPRTISVELLPGATATVTFRH